MVRTLTIGTARYRAHVRSRIPDVFLCAALLMVAAFQTVAAQGTVVINDVVVIDGRGGSPNNGMTVVVEDGVISQIGSAGSITIPAESAVIDGSGKYLLPGFIDSNVHASIYGNSRRRETVVKYGERNEDLILEFVQLQLMHGVTTVRDSYGALVPLMAVRDRIARGEAVGSRMLVAGNIVGWGGPFSMTFSLMVEADLTLFQAKWNDWISQGVGEDLMDMGPDEVRAAINAYLNKGPDFIKFGGTSHFESPSLIGFSPRIQKVLVEETHKRGLIAETHSTSPEALRMSVEAGIDLIQHPEILSRDYPDDLLEMIVDRDVLCAMRSNTLTGDVWQEHLVNKAQEELRLQDAPEPQTSAEQRQRDARLNVRYEIQRRNAERLIQAGCRVTIATDNYQGRAPEFRKVPKPEIQNPGIGSILAIEGLVELGMTEAEAIVAATQNGAIAAGMSDSIGTVEVGKKADLVILRDDPLEDIRNIRSIDYVIARGDIVDLDALPATRVFSSGPEQVSLARQSAQQAETTHSPAAEPDAALPETSRSIDTTDSPFGENLPVASVKQSPLGNLIIVMEDGHQWRQLNSDNTRVILPSDRSNLRATIKPGFLGSVTMTIIGTRRSFKVSRIE